MEHICPACFGEGSGGVRMTASGVDDKACSYCNGTGEQTVPKHWLFIEQTGDCVLAEFRGDLAKADLPSGTFYARFDNQWRWIERPVTNGFGI